MEVGLDEPGQEAEGAVRGLLRGAVGWCWPELRRNPSLRRSRGVRTRERLWSVLP